jgi:hypothetical protein
LKCSAALLAAMMSPCQIPRCIPAIRIKAVETGRLTPDPALTHDTAARKQR